MREGARMLLCRIIERAVLCTAVVLLKISVPVLHTGNVPYNEVHYNGLNTEPGQDPLSQGE